MQRALILILLLVPAVSAGASATCSDGRAEIIIEGEGQAGCFGGGDPPVVLAAGGLALAGLMGAGWIMWFRWMPIMGLFTRLRKDRLLDHPARAHLHQAIEEEPGIHFQALLDRTGLANGQASHHLSVMVRAGLLTAVRARGYATYFLYGTVDAPIMMALGAVRSPTAVEVLRAVAARPGVATRSVARQLGRPESTVRHHASRLHAAGVLHDDMQISAIGERVMGFIPDAIGRPRHPPGPAQ